MIFSRIGTWDSGRIVGCAYDTREHDKGLSVEVRIGGKVIASTQCDQPVPKFAPARVPPNSGFRFRPSQSPGAWLTEPVSVSVVGAEEPINKDPWFLHSKIYVATAEPRKRRLALELNVPEELQSFVKLEATVEGREAKVRHVGSDGPRYLIELSHESDQSRPEFVLRMVGRNQPLPLSDQGIRWIASGALAFSALPTITGTEPTGGTVESNITSDLPETPNVGAAIDGFTNAKIDPEGAPVLDVSPVRNGEFKFWSNGFIFSAAERRVQTADHWHLSSKIPTPSLTARLVHRSYRDLSETGGGREDIYGVGLSGNAPDSWFRLEGQLDAEAFLAGRFKAISFIIGRVDETKSNTRPRIDRVFLCVRKPSGGDGKYKVEPIHVLAANVTVPSSPTRLHYVVGPSEHKKITEYIRASSLEDSDSFCFAVQFKSQYANCFIADVKLTEDLAEEKTVASSELEDVSITAQAKFLKGIEHWADGPGAAEVRSSDAVSSLGPRTWEWSDLATKIDLVIPVFNAPEHVKACLESIERCTAIPHRVVLVDDGSDLETQTFLQLYAQSRPWVDLIVNKKNIGYTRACNMGMSRSRADWLALLNSDLVVTDGWLEGLLECAISSPGVAAVGPLSNAASWQSIPEMKDAGGRWRTNRYPDGMTHTDIARLVQLRSLRAFPRVPLLNGFCTLFNREAIEAVGFLDEVAYPVGYGEENDLCIRLLKAGYELAIADHVYVHHAKSMSFGTLRRQELSKLGTKATKDKHPDIDLEDLRKVMAECVPLIELRKALRSEIVRIQSLRSEQEA